MLYLRGCTREVRLTTVFVPEKLYEGGEADHCVCT